MTQKFYTTKEAAELLGVPPSEVNSLRERNVLRGFRDGADWKFKVEDVEAYARQRRYDSSAGQQQSSDSSEDDVVLLDDRSSDADASGTVIGSPERSEGAESDVQLGGSDLDLEGSDFASVQMQAESAGEEQGESASQEQPAAEAEQRPPSETPELDSLGEPLDLEEASDQPIQQDNGSQLDLSPVGEAQQGEQQAEAPAESEGEKPDSSVDLTPGADAGEEDEVILGDSGSGSGSDITLGTDSGISLLDSNDSGISLEDPLELAPVDESLELGEDDILTLAEDADTESPTQLKTDDEFLLTPLDEASEEESASGSQVIALDTEVPIEELGEEQGAAPMLGEAGVPGGFPGMEAPGAGPQAPGGIPQQPTGPMAQPAYAATAAPAEAPWGTLWTTMVIVSAVLLMLCGMMCFDLMRNMWSWQGPFQLNSAIMDTILEVLPK